MRSLNLVIGLTGGIGSGKSTVTNLFAQHGVPIIDTDDIARQITHSSEITHELKSHFGEVILNTDQSINRRKLRQLIFEDDNHRTWLEELVHPLVRKEVERQIQPIEYPYCIVAIPLLFETSPNPLIDRILVIDADETDQIKRTTVRDNTSEDEIISIIAKQAPRHVRLTGAHDVIHNDKDLAHLKDQVNRLHQYYLKLAENSR